MNSDEDDDIGIEDLLANTKDRIELASESNLQQSSMYHLNIKKRDVVHVMQFEHV